MKCSCDRDMLFRHLSMAARGASTRSSIQVLAGVQLAAHGDELHLSTTDMDISVRTRLEAVVGNDGVVVAPAKLLLGIIRGLSGEVVELEGSDGTLIVSSAGSTYTLKTFDPEDFPKLPATTGTLFSVDRDTFLSSIQSVARAAGADESRPVLTGVKVQISAEMLTMVATDSYRLSVRETPMSTDLPEPLEAIVPARALEELVRVADASPAATFAVGIEANQILFGIDESWLTARRIEGQFPNHAQLIPQSFEHEAVVDRAELLDVINRARIMAQRNSPLRLHFTDGLLTISASTQDVGAAEESLPIRYDGEELMIGFNADFLRDGVQSMTGDNIKIQLISPLRPGLLRSDEDPLVYLIMPVRLPD